MLKRRRECGVKESRCSVIPLFRTGWLPGRSELSTARVHGPIENGEPCQSGGDDRQGREPGQHHQQRDGVQGGQHQGAVSNAMPMPQSVPGPREHAVYEQPQGWHMQYQVGQSGKGVHVDV